MFGRKNTKEINIMIGDPEYEKQVMKAFDMKPKKSHNPFTWLRRRREQKEYELFLLENNKFVMASETLQKEFLLLGQIYTLFSV